MGREIAFLGGGNMASAIIGGLLSSGVATKEEISATAKTRETARSLRERFGIRTGTDNAAAASRADILFLAVKPHVLPDVIAEVRDALPQDALVISIAAGTTISSMERMFSRKVKLVRAMPNTPALVREAMTAVCANSEVSEAELAEAVRLFACLGKCEVVPETLMDTVVGVSGSSPAYVFMLIEAMADAAVADGMPRAQAYRFAGQAVLGSAKLALETGKHPGELKDSVCSPGGTTIEAVAVLEEKGLRDAVLSAQRACVRKSKEMGRKEE